MNAPPDMNTAPFHLFEAYGVELEYMIVDARTLSVMPVADRLLQAVAAQPGSEPDFEDESPVPTEVARGGVSWSNELVRHVVELKLSEPAAGLAGCAPDFQREIARADALLEPMGARLMAGAMHPWMDPSREMELWPFGYQRFYSTFDRIFDCRGHGWANLQAVHLNLPFDGDEEFGCLHAAVRALLPIMPALAASSPVYAGVGNGVLDNRMEVYRSNARAVPTVAGRIVPEPVYCRADYQSAILDRIYRDLAGRDPEGVLRHEWVNSRGCIARFERNTIEVRVLDVQECPAADLAVCAAVGAVVRALCAADGSDREFLRNLSVERLEAVLLSTVRDADTAVIRDLEYLRALGIPAVPASGLTAREAWTALIEGTLGREEAYAEFAPALRTIVQRGCLSRRILAALDGNFERANLSTVYRGLADCLVAGRQFDGV